MDNRESNGQFRKRYFMTLPPIYLIGSAYLMQAALKKEPIDQLSVGLSMLAIIVALFFTYVSLFNIPKSWMRTIEYLAGGFGIIGAMFLPLTFINSFGKLLDIEASPWYVWLFLISGVIILLGVAVFHLINIIKNR